MAKQKPKAVQQQKRFGDSMTDEVILIIIVVICIVILISVLTRKMGILGSALGEGLKGVFGISSILLPISIIAYCSWLLTSEEKKNREIRIGGVALFIAAISALVHVINPIEVSIMSTIAENLQSYYQEGAFNNGGLLGGILGGIIMKAFGKIGAMIIWFAVLLISIIMATGKSLFKGVSNVNSYQKKKRKQYHEKRQQLEIVREKKEVPYIQEVPKNPAKSLKMQQVPKAPVKPPKIQQKPQPKLRQKQSVKKKKNQKNNFNILLHEDEGYNQNKQQAPIVEATIFKSKNNQNTQSEQTIQTEQNNKIPVIFDYGKTESEILAEQQLIAPMPEVEQAVENLPNEEISSDIISAEAERKLSKLEQIRQIRIEKEKQREKQRELEKEQRRLKELEKQRQQQMENGVPEQEEKQNDDVHYMIFPEEEAPQQTPQTEETKSDTEDIADVLALLNSIQFEEEEMEQPSQQEDIMEIVADWAEEQKEEPPSSGLSLFLVEDEEEIEQTQKQEEIQQQSEQTQQTKLEQTEKKTQIIPQQTQQKDKMPQNEIKQIEHNAEQQVQQPKAKQVINAEQTIQQQEYVFPPFDLLSKNSAVQSSQSKSEMLVNAKKLESTLKSFGVAAKVIQINKGPTVTRYELSPSQGVKVSKIVNLADDIALNLAASGIRIEAPIPGKAAVGIEVPNKQAQSVYLRSVLESETFQNFESKLAFALGEDITGQPVVTDIAKMPHLLIAGATGSGKSVCINTLITSILYKAKPEEVKLLLVDPKVVELSIYNGIPHLLIPVVTDPKKASSALNWAVKEMLKRYNDFAENGVRDIKGYNAIKKENGEGDYMPQIVIIIDELADLMLAAPGEVEDAICRLAQMARAAGMHLIIATQRPSVDVITGVIKANIPSRLAFAVSSGVDSRTILDMTGAEKLLGKGDMLFCPQGTNKPVRIQGAFLSDKEVESIVRFVKEHGTIRYDNDMIDEITTTEKSDDMEEYVDSFFEQAVELLIQKQKGSTSMLQRQFHIGYNRAARLMEYLEQQGIVGQEEGSKPRKVLITKQQWEERKATK